VKPVQIGLVLLIVVPAFINFYVPIYNFINPELGGLPFFYWFQILLLLLTTLPYLAFSYIENKRKPDASRGESVK
jgi:hypothetical protein